MSQVVPAKPVDPKNIKYLFELRHSYNCLGAAELVAASGIRWGVVEMLRQSDLHGSTNIEAFKKLTEEECAALITRIKTKFALDREKKEYAKQKNDFLLQEYRNKYATFASIGLTQAIKRLGLEQTSPVSAALRLAIYIESDSVRAKTGAAQVREELYQRKHKRINKLADLFDNMGWVYGIHDCPNPCTSHVIYFNIPGCAQLSWHFSPHDPEAYPCYPGVWEKKGLSNLSKLEIAVTTILLENKHNAEKDQGSGTTR